VAGVKRLSRTSALAGAVSFSAPFLILAILTSRRTWPVVARVVARLASFVGAELQEWRP
jgi:hypothetical protein